MILNKIVYIWIFLFVCSISAGFTGIILNKNRNLLILLMFLEVLYFGIGFGFLGFSYLMLDFKGQIIAITLLSLSAAESAVGLSLVVTSHKKLNTTDCNKFNNVKY